MINDLINTKKKMSKKRMQFLLILESEVSNTTE